VLVSHEILTHVGDFLDASLRWNDGRDWVDLGAGVGMTGRGLEGWVLDEVYAGFGSGLGMIGE